MGLFVYFFVRLLYNVLSKFDWIIVSKAKIKTQTESGFRVIFKTADGSLVMNRSGSREFYFEDKYFTRPSINVEEFIRPDARAKGVRILSYTLDRNGLNAIVQWLK